MGRKFLLLLLPVLCASGMARADEGIPSCPQTLKDYKISKDVSNNADWGFDLESKDDKNVFRFGEIYLDDASIPNADKARAAAEDIIQNKSKLQGAGIVQINAKAYHGCYYTDRTGPDGYDTPTFMYVYSPQNPF